MEFFIKENTWLSRSWIDCGWGNGYVLIPVGHPAHGVHYDSIDVNVHGGLTFSEMVDESMVENWKELNESHIGMWCVGFDTAHYSDNLSRWPKQRVKQETMDLMEQLKMMK